MDAWRCPCYNIRMAQTREGAIKVAAQLIGISPKEYIGHVSSGEKWCTGCKAWHPTQDFGPDKSRPDGLSAKCRNYRRALYKERRLIPPPRPRIRGRSFVPARNGDKLQARRRINYFVEAELIPHPNDLPCMDCGHVYGQDNRRHEYDHHLGYASKHHEHVQAVCSRCHHARERDRNGQNQDRLE